MQRPQNKYDITLQLPEVTQTEFLLTILEKGWKVLNKKILIQILSVDLTIPNFPN